MGRDGRIRPRWQGTRVSSGRLSCADAPLQTIPVRTKLGKLVRNAFIPAPGYRFVAGDFNQIELRILAHESRDAKMIETYLRGGDIHMETALAVNRLERLEQVTSKLRRDAKTVNFGIIYGLSPGGLLNSIPPEDRDPAVHTPKWANQFMESYFRLYSGVRAYIDGVIAFVRRNGYIQDMFGRRRYLPEVLSTSNKIKALGEREAQNMPIQAGAAGVLKMAMEDLITLCGKGVLDALIASNAVRAVLQVHDELIFEVLEACWEEVAAMVKRTMERVGEELGMVVPLVVDVEVGDSWGSLEKVQA